MEPNLSVGLYRLLDLRDGDRRAVDHLAHLLVTYFADDDPFHVRDRVFFPRVRDALLVVEEIDNTAATRRAGMIAIRAVLRSQDLLDAEAERRTAEVSMGAATSHQTRRDVDDLVVEGLAT